MVAFLAGVVRIPASLLELMGVLPPDGPHWYLLFQALLGIVQFAIGLAAWVVLGERMSWPHVLGMALITTGILLVR